MRCINYNEIWKHTLSALFINPIAIYLKNKNKNLKYCILCGRHLLLFTLICEASYYHFTDNND